MVVTIGGIPVYDAIISDGDTGMIKISLVDDPAVMSNFQHFDNQRPLMMYSVEDDEKRLVRGVIMRSDFPIYRRDDSLGEYYIIYRSEQIRTMAEKYLVENRQNNFNLMHEDDTDVEGIQMVQFFIKDTEAGVSPAGFEEIADGSLFGEFHVTNDEVWDEIKKGTYKGFSLEGYFDLAPEQDKESVEEIVDSLGGKFSKTPNNNSNNSIMSKLKRLKTALVKVLTALGAITTDKGILVWDGDEDLKAGDSVYVEDAEGNRTPAEDGDYKTEDNKVIKVADGKVTEITDAEAEVAPAEESTEEQMGSKTTDKGEILWNGEEDLKEGDEVFVEKDGERVPAEDGEYKTEDGKVIKVTDGKVESITDDEAEVATELKAKRQTFLKRIREAFEDSYEEKERKIIEAISASLPEGTWAYLQEAGDTYAVVAVIDEDWNESLVKYEITWDEEGNVTLGASEEVKPAFVPVDEPNPAEPEGGESAPSEEEFNAVKAENETLKAELEKYRKSPMTTPLHETMETFSVEEKTGDRRLDRLARYSRLVAESRANRK